MGVRIDYSSAEAATPEVRACDPGGSGEVSELPPVGAVRTASVLSDRRRWQATWG